MSEQFLAATTVFDVRGIDALLSPDAGRWVNITDRYETKAEFLRSVELERSLLRDATFSPEQLIIGEEAFVLRLTVEATTLRGHEVRVAACLVVSVSDGLITAIHEYADSSQIRPILNEINFSARPEDSN